jgi:hypothetical protein
MSKDKELESGFGKLRAVLSKCFNESHEAENFGVGKYESLLDNLDSLESFLTENDWDLTKIENKARIDL